jgi:hypothetical protein
MKNGGNPNKIRVGQPILSSYPYSILFRQPSRNLTQIQKPLEIEW